MDGWEPRRTQRLAQVKTAVRVWQAEEKAPEVKARSAGPYAFEYTVPFPEFYASSDLR